MVNIKTSFSFYGGEGNSEPLDSEAPRCRANHDITDYEEKKTISRFSKIPVKRLDISYIIESEGEKVPESPHYTVAFKRKMTDSHKLSKTFRKSWKLVPVKVEGDVFMVNRNSLSQRMGISLEKIQECESATGQTVDQVASSMAKLITNTLERHADIAQYLLEFGEGIDSTAANEAALWLDEKWESFHEATDSVKKEIKGVWFTKTKDGVQVTVPGKKPDHIVGWDLFKEWKKPTWMNREAPEPKPLPELPKTPETVSLSPSSQSEPKVAKPLPKPSPRPRVRRFKPLPQPKELSQLQQELKEAELSEVSKALEQFTLAAKPATLSAAGGGREAIVDAAADLLAKLSEAVSAVETPPEIKQKAVEVLAAVDQVLEAQDVVDSDPEDTTLSSLAQARQGLQDLGEKLGTEIEEKRGSQRPRRAEIPSTRPRKRRGEQMGQGVRAHDVSFAKQSTSQRAKQSQPVFEMGPKKSEGGHRRRRKERLKETRQRELRAFFARIEKHVVEYLLKQDVNKFTNVKTILAEIKKSHPDAEHLNIESLRTVLEASEKLHTLGGGGFKVKTEYRTNLKGMRELHRQRQLRGKKKP